MQNSTKQLGVLLIIISAFIIMPTQAADKLDETVSATILVKDHLSGGWTYTAAGAPDGFDQGFMLIVKSGDTYKVKIQTAAGVFTATDVEGKGHKIKFNLSVEGESVAVSLVVSGSEITGTSTYSTGVVNIKGTKSISAD